MNIYKNIIISVNESTAKFKFNDQMLTQEQIAGQMKAVTAKPLIELILKADPLLTQVSRGNQFKAHVQADINDYSLAFRYKASDTRTPTEKMQPILKMMKTAFGEAPIDGSDVIPEMGTEIGGVDLAEDGRFVQFIVKGWKPLGAVELDSIIRVHLEFSTSKTGLFVNVKFTLTPEFSKTAVYENYR